VVLQRFPTSVGNRGQYARRPSQVGIGVSDAAATLNAPPDVAIVLLITFHCVIRHGRVAISPKSRANGA